MWFLVVYFNLVNVVGWCFLFFLGGGGGGGGVFFINFSADE